jgi:hypothetical protein
MARATTARITALRPAQSPPLVNIPSVFRDLSGVRLGFSRVEFDMSFPFFLPPTSKLLI